MDILELLVPFLVHFTGTLWCHRSKTTELVADQAESLSGIHISRAIAAADGRHSSGRIDNVRGGIALLSYFSHYLRMQWHLRLPQAANAVIGLRRPHILLSASVTSHACSALHIMEP